MNRSQYSFHDFSAKHTPKATLIFFPTKLLIFLKIYWFNFCLIIKFKNYFVNAITSHLYLASSLHLIVIAICPCVWIEDLATKPNYPRKRTNLLIYQPVLIPSVTKKIKGENFMYGCSTMGRNNGKKTS